MGRTEAPPTVEAPMIMGEAECVELGDVVVTEQPAILEPLQEQNVKREMGKIMQPAPPAK